MPTVPSYDLPQEQQRLPNLPVGSLPPAQAPAVVPMKNYAGVQTEQLGQAVQSAGSVAMKIGQRLQNEADDAEAKKLFAEFSLALDKIEINYDGLHGKDAVDQTIQTRKDVDALKASYLQRAQNPMQQILFDAPATVRSHQVGHKIMAHSVHEAHVFGVQSSEAKISALIEAATLAGQGEAFETNYRAAVVESQQLGKLLGYGDDKALQDKLTLSVTDRIAKAELSAMVDGHRYTEAKQYLAAHRTEMSADTRQHAEKALQIGEDATTEQADAGRIWEEAKGDIVAARDIARRTLSGAQEDHVIARLNVLSQEVDAARQFREREAKATAWRAYEQGRTITVVTPTMLAAMNPQDRHTLESTAATDLAAKLKSEEVHTDSAVYYTLSTMAANDPNQFKRLNLQEYFPKLGPTERKHFIDLQNKPNADTFTATQQIEASLKSMHLSDGVAGQFLVDAQARIVQAEQKKGAALTEAERGKIINNAALNFPFIEAQKKLDKEKLQVKTDVDVYDKLHDRIARDPTDPVQWGDYARSISRDDLKALHKFQDAEVEKSRSVGKQSLEAQIKDLSVSTKLDKAASAEFSQVAHQAIQGMQSRGERLTQRQTADLLRGLLEQGETVGVPREFWDHNMRRYEAIQQGKGEYFKSFEQPQAKTFDPDLASQAFQKITGRPPTRAEMARMEAHAK